MKELNFSTELDFTDCFKGFWRDQIFKVMWCKQFQFLGFGNFEWVFRRFVFIQAKYFFLKIYLKFFNF